MPCLFPSFAANANAFAIAHLHVALPDSAWYILNTTSQFAPIGMLA